MGYRSKVCISMPMNEFDKATKNPKIKMLIMQDADRVIKTGDNEIVVLFESIKWYTNCEGYEDLTELENFILDSDKSLMIRIGEKVDDVEIYGEGDSIYLTRDISIPDGTPVEFE